MKEFHPCTMAKPSVWLALAWANRGIAPKYWRKFAGTLAVSALATPLRLAEWATYGRKVNRQALDGPPLFLLGFARSGTTHLQNLVSQDPRWAAFTAYQAVTWTFSLTGRKRLKPLMEKGMAQQGEQTRPMDNVAITLDAPQEEDLAVSHVTPMSFVHQLSFPNRALDLLAKYVMMGRSADGEWNGTLTRRELRRWERAYGRVVRKVALHGEGKPVMLRNTMNIGRSLDLLRLFPGAKFVHIIRNPYSVYPSLMNLFRTLLPEYHFVDIDWDEVERSLVESYRQVMTKYLHDRDQIPEGQLVEMRYEDLERDPMGELRRVYEALDLPAWSVAEPHVKEYLETLAGYQKNRFDMAQEDIERVQKHWGFALDAWGYEVPPPPPRISPKTTD